LPGFGRVPRPRLISCQEERERSEKELTKHACKLRLVESSSPSIVVDIYMPKEN
jgi:hypothetical protein